MTGLVRLALGLAALAANPAPTLVDVVGAGDPVAIADHLIALGRTIDLSDAAQVTRALGRVAGLPTRRSQASRFAGYTLPAGEIVFNPEAGGKRVLLVGLETCIPAATLLRRLRTADFGPRPVDVALYSDVPYLARPGMAFTYLDTPLACIRSFGLSQRTAPA